MSPLKSGTIRVLRSKVLSQNPSGPGGINRAITLTAKNAISFQTTRKSDMPASITTSGRVPRYYPKEICSVTYPFSHSLEITHSSLPYQHSTQPLPRHQKSSSPTEFFALLDSITESLTSTPRPSLPHLHSLLRAYNSDFTHWSSFAHANPAKQYTRNLVCEVPRLFNLLLLVWTPGKASPIHDHADAHCLMKILKGSLCETRFATPANEMEGPLVQTSKVSLGANKVAYISDQLGLHEISNPSLTEYAVSLHLYTPPNAAIRGCHIYDVGSGKKKHVMQGMYDSIKGEVSSA